MGCYQDGQLVGGGGGPSPLTNVLYDETNGFTTASSTFTWLFDSDLYIPAGDWVILFSVEAHNLTSPYTVACQFWDQTNSIEIALGYKNSNQPFDYSAFKGVWYTTLAGLTQFRWRIRAVGGGTAEARRARIVALEDT